MLIFQREFSPRNGVSVSNKLESHEKRNKEFVQRIDKLIFNLSYDNTNSMDPKTTPKL